MLRLTQIVKYSHEIFTCLLEDFITPALLDEIYTKDYNRTRFSFLSLFHQRYVKPSSPGFYHDSHHLCTNNLPPSAEWTPASFQMTNAPLGRPFQSFLSILVHVFFSSALLYCSKLQQISAFMIDRYNNLLF